jgi:hypothetical protein
MKLVVRRYVPPPLGELGRRVLLLLLAALVVLNVVDFALTRYSLWLGFATESNSVMDFLFKESDVAAALFKFGMVTGGAAALWLLRRYRAALLAGVLLTAVFAAVVVYQALWLVSL